MTTFRSQETDQNILATLRGKRRWEKLLGRHQNLGKPSSSPLLSTVEAIMLIPNKESKMSKFKFIAILAS
jgi:hypothetical protein